MGRWMPPRQGVKKLDLRDEGLRFTIREEQDMHTLHVSKHLVEVVSGSRVVLRHGR